MIFKTPLLLLLLPVVLGLMIFLKRRRQSSSFVFPSAHLVKELPKTWKVRLKDLTFYLRLVVMALFIVALAGPRSILEETVSTSEGIDIVLVIDASGSMAAEDFTINGQRKNRLAVVKGVVSDFIEGRQYDRIGLVAFSALAYTVCPLTTDYSWLRENLSRVELGLIKDGTAIGSSIATALGRFKKSKAASKIIILLTDGVNNAGKVDPVNAARAAKAMGIKVYTIGAGTRGLAPFPVQDIWGRTVYRKVQIDVDEATLQKIAEMTGGEYYRATDTNSLKEIYQQIDSMEKTEIEQFHYKEYKELFVYVLAAALLLLLVELILSSTVLMRLPG